MFNRRQKVLIVCSNGRNRSRHLKEHLRDQGIASFAMGMNNKNRDAKRRVENAKFIICVHPEVEEVFRENHKIKEQVVICLDVDEQPTSAETAGKRVTGEEWTQYQEEYVYPELEKQIKKYIKKLS